MKTFIGLLALIAILLLPPRLAAQEALSVSAGWGVDTTGAVAWTDAERADVVREIFRRWATYLRSNPRAQAPTRLWSEAEQRTWRQYDLTASIAYQGVPATVLEITPAEAGQADRFLVRTLFASSDGGMGEVRPIALTRVYAVREQGQWVFSGALPYLTRSWRRETVGPITYVLEPGYPFDTARARRAVAFADSLAVAYEVPRLEQLTYYLLTSPEQVHRVMGVDWTVPGTGYGYSSPWNRLILSGAPAAGEDYRHELVHFLFMPLTAAGRTHPLVNEGVASWLGGSMGRDYPTLMAEYQSYLRQHPEVTLDIVLQEAGPDRGVRPAGALLTLMVFEKGGVAGVKALLATGRSTDELKAGLERLLHARWPEIAATWRRRALDR